MQSALRARGRRAASASRTTGSSSTAAVPSASAAPAAGPGGAGARRRSSAGRRPRAAVTINRARRTSPWQERLWRAARAWPGCAPACPTRPRPSSWPTSPA